MISRFLNSDSTPDSVAALVVLAPILAVVSVLVTALNVLQAVAS